MGEFMVKIINRLAYSIARYLAMNLDKDNEMRRVYYYGLQMIVPVIFLMIAISVISILAGNFIVSISTFFLLMIIKSVTGGVHMASSGKCFIVSLMQVVIISVLGEYIFDVKTREFGWVIFFVTMIIFFVSNVIAQKWVPKDNPNKLIESETKRQLFKKKTKVLLFFCMLTAIILLFNKDFNKYAVTIDMSVLLSMFSVSPIGSKVYDKIDKIGMKNKV